MFVQTCADLVVRQRLARGDLAEAFLDLAYEPIVVVDQALDRFASQVLPGGWLVRVPPEEQIVSLVPCLSEICQSLQGAGRFGFLFQSSTNTGRSEAGDTIRQATREPR